jgi:hypothetical protein
MQGSVSALLGSADGTSFPDAARLTGVVALDDRRIRALISTDAVTARANAVPGARVAVLVTDIVTYRSIQLKGAVVSAGDVRSPGDVALADHHVKAFVAAAPVIGIDPAKADHGFAVEVVPLVIEVDELFDQTPGPGAGRRIEARR